MTATVLHFPAMAENRDRYRPKPEMPNRVREWRKARGMTLDTLAQAVGCAIGHVQRIETGARDLNLYWMEKIAAALAVTPADLLKTGDGGLTAEERALIETYREVPQALRGSYDALREQHQPFRGAPELVDLSAHRKSG